MAAMIQKRHEFDITIDINLVTIFFQHLLAIKLAMDKNFPVAPTTEDLYVSPCNLFIYLFIHSFIHRFIHFSFNGLISQIAAPIDTGFSPLDRYC